MPHSLRCFLFVLGACWLLSGLPAAAQAPAAPPTVPGRLVFKLRPPYIEPAQVPGLPAALQRLGAGQPQPKFPRSQPPGPDQPGAVNLRLVYQVELPAGASVAAACRRLGLLTEGVEYAEPLYVRQPLLQPNDPLADSLRADGQYYLKNIQAYRAWDITQGDTSLVIGIVDGGTRFTHEDLATQVQLNRQDPIDGLDNDQDGYVDNYRGWDFADQDNDPSRDASTVHGILVAGCAAAAPDNGRGIAGVGFRCRFLPLKIYPSTPTGTFGGYEAIVYAADHGCRVINLSWGGVGGRSRFEQDVITYAAVNRDAVVVAAAGNTPAELDFYPASYEHVLSVATLTPTDERSPSATFSRRVDLSAPGTGILTTRGNTDSDYVAVGGSSFAAPLVAGAAALVRTRFPQYTAAQVAAQLRRTCDNIDARPGNVAYVGRMGAGRLNVRRAVAEAGQVSAQVISQRPAPARPGYSPGDTLRLTVAVHNLLRPVAGLTVTLTSLSAHLTVRQGVFAVGSLATLEQRSNSAAPFRLVVAAAGVPLNTRAVLRYRLHDAATGYQEDQYETILLNPDFVVLDAGDLHLTLTSRGQLGYDGPDLGAGVSYQPYRNGAPLLYEGGLLVATPPARVSDNLRNDRRSLDQDFFALAQVQRRAPAARADQEAFGTLRDSLPSLTQGRTVGVRVRQRALAWAAAPHRNYVVLEYTLTNLTADTLRPLHAGLFLDWDLPPDPGHNVVAWDSVRRLSYVHAATAPGIYAGVQHLAGGQPTVYALDNQAPAGTAVRLADGFSAAEKLLTLSSGTRQAAAGGSAGTDVSQVVGATLPRLAPADSAVVAFAVLAAPTLAQLQTSAQAAQARYQQVLEVSGPRRAAVRLYPNPAADVLHVELPVADTGVVQLFSPLGQLLLECRAAAAPLTLPLSGYPAGLYIVRVLTAAGTSTHRVVHVP
ncbi:S8 family peptidase [Hymenobacter weizhouensis]|uniref:S8 family peptidase n=1 Tax=Hymenobacter sp. YIM 151500-1 TaxID=2987689 RepID=UPI002226AD46|nr:S8 family peptidase [Hymenobacter sp. YIM 151500-1]UYZ64787.1 S8 family peptidase [Hymenobacter sp. YIM 151500-1]